MDYSEIEENFVSFLGGIESLINDINEEKLKLPPKFNIVDCIGGLYDEVKNSQIIKSVLKIEFIRTDNNEKIFFAKLFIDYLNEKYLSENDKIKNFEDRNINVLTEVSTDKWRRIDILIEVDKSNAIIIENKIYASDGYNQLDDYYQDIKNKYKNVYVLYLTRYASDVTEYSLSEENREELGEKFICISHGDIGLWLENILDNDVSFIKTDEKYKFIYSALVQIIENEKILGGISEEDNVEKEKVKEYVNDFISKNNVTNIKEYGAVLKQASDYFYYSVYSVFYKEVYEELIKYNIENLQLDGNADNFITNQIINKKSGYRKYLSISFANTPDLFIAIEFHSSYRIVGIIDNRNAILKKKLEELQEEINKIYTIFIKSAFWSAYKHIDENTNKPKEIADIIYKLYKLLKDNGF